MTGPLATTVSLGFLALSLGVGALGRYGVPFAAEANASDAGGRTVARHDLVLGATVAAGERRRSLSRTRKHPSTWRTGRRARATDLQTTFRVHGATGSRRWNVRSGWSKTRQRLLPMSGPKCSSARR